MMATELAVPPGWEGTRGPFPSEYGQPHVYARDVHSGAGNCVCGRALVDHRHVQTAPGVPIPGEPAELADLPPEVRALVHAVDQMRDRWAEADDTVQYELWRTVHEANDAVWNRGAHRREHDGVPHDSN
ncbi:hypothetical protein [Streptosporangium sp. NPDC049376]|uniref:hypothetical protein n=1 Tax=Streptosporangium sp. NPDC049376 TaxID=3366192 RepID=UPI003793EC30